MFTRSGTPRWSLNGGQVTATVTSIDLAGNGQTQSISYTVDDTAPSLLASSSFSPATNNTGTTKFTLVASKPLSSATTLQMNNGTTSFSNGSNGISIAPDGATTFPCTSCVFDIFGLAPSGNTSVTWHAVANMVDTVPTPNTASATSTAAYVVDKTLPSANSFAVSPGIVRAGQQVTITGTATKALSGVAITTSNNDASNQACSFNASNNFTCLVTVADASNEVATATVVLTDSVNNVSAGIAAGSYTVDNTAPTISAVTVGTGSSIPVSAYAYFKKAATVSVEVDALDCNLKTVAVAASYVSTSTGQPVSASMTLANTPGSVGCSTTTKYLFQRAVAADEPNGSTSLSVQATGSGW